MPRFNSCNLLQAGVDTRRVWQFDARSAGFKLNREHAAHGGNALPSGVVEKSWSSLWQPKLNVAWLPSDCVFLRVVHLPAGSPAEVHSMIELQLERLSPIPITQMVWSVQVLGTTPAGLQTAIITFAERKAVEDFLGKLESQGYLADRLELPDRKSVV